MRNRMHFVIPSLILLVLAIPAVPMLWERWGEESAKKTQTKTEIKKVVGSIIGYSEQKVYNADGSFNLSDKVEAKDAWGTEIKVEIEEVDAKGIYLFSKRPKMQKLNIISAGPDRQFGTRDDMSETYESKPIK